MVFHTPQKQLNPLQLQINRIPITQVENFTFLGIVLNHHMSWKPHLQKISNKIAKITGILNKMKHILPNYILLKIYQALILPHLNYGILAWGHNTQSIASLQKRAIRVITNSKYNDHTSPIFSKLNLLTITDIKTLFELKFYYKLINRQLPEYFLHNFIQTNEQSQTRQINTRHQQRLAIPLHRHDYFKTGLRYRLINTVNNTPPELLHLTLTHSIDAFSSRIKKHLIDKYPTSCNINNCYICSRRTT